MLLPIRWIVCLLVLWLPLVATAQIAQRVVSLAPNLTEMAFAAGIGDKLVGVSAYSDYPSAAKRIEQVANWQGVNVERILALKPDLILAWRGGNPQRPLDQLASFGIKVLYLDPQTIEQVAQALDQLATYSATPQLATQTAEQIRQQQQALVARFARRTPVPVFIQFGTQPLFTAGSATLHSQIVTLCGGKNVFADSHVPWPQVSREQVLMRHPQAIVITGSQQQAQDISAFWKPALNLPIIALNPDWFSRAGPRIMLAAQQLCLKLDKSRINK
ncbi:vitamin B12 ABC transporter substrate-binding protein BtuF [Rouxiella sp. Mn2063]|uniref:vitamin B12 ABC transporter substrate-binding protein BtuF n=1 Tax=Rouxiella sp. Mn2063 TaxID=3395262 RepID=UPI003BDA95D1